MTALPATWCSCGCSEPHTILARRTADHVLVELTSDGAVWFGMVREPGRGMSPRRSPEAAERVKLASRVVLGWAEVYTVAELQELLIVARSMAKLPSTIAEVRAEQERQNAPARPRLHWVVTAMDSRGKVTERTCWLPRLRWPGMAVVDFCGSVGSSGGRYVVFRRVSGTRDVAKPTGFAFRRLADLWTFLDGEGRR